MNKNYYYPSGCIKWRLVPSQSISPEQFNEKLLQLNITETVEGSLDRVIMGQMLPPTSKREYFTCEHLTLVPKIFITRASNSYQIYTFEKENNIYVPKVWLVRLTLEDDVLEDMANGLEAYRYVIGAFKLKYGLSFNKAYGNDGQEFKTYVPKPINECIPNPIEPYCGISKIDIKSAYATEASKELPTTIDKRTYDHYEVPNNVYKFAFYLLSDGKTEISIYGEWAAFINRNDVIKTTLMKAAPYTIASILGDVFEKKEHAATKGDKLYFKSILNLFVGYCQRNSNPAQAHIAAVVIARCNHRVRVAQEHIEQNGGQVVLINTDSIAWIGNKALINDFDTTSGKLGSFTNEGTNIAAYIYSPKKYQLQQPDGTVINRWAGVRKQISRCIAWGLMGRIKEVPAHWEWNKEQFKFIKVATDIAANALI